jgi:hypothetical protein
MLRPIGKVPPGTALAAQHDTGLPSSVHSVPAPVQDWPGGHPSGTDLGGHRVTPTNGVQWGHPLVVPAEPGA